MKKNNVCNTNEKNNVMLEYITSYWLYEDYEKLFKIFTFFVKLNLHQICIYVYKYVDCHIKDSVSKRMTDIHWL